MGNILYLVHRIPYPPNKGDKVRSYHLLKHLLLKNRVFLGTFIDSSEDKIYIEDLRCLCPDSYIEQLHPTARKIFSLSGFLTHDPLTISYYKSSKFQAWVNQTLAENLIDVIVIFSSSMAQFIPLNQRSLKTPPLLVDFVDVDSEKWLQYASKHNWIFSWLYQRESRLLRTYEIALAKRAKSSFFVTKEEANIFKKIVPFGAEKILSLSNGVDTKFFSPDLSLKSPYVSSKLGSNAPVIVFTGAMDYWPNIDAVIWFSYAVWPKLIKIWPNLCFYIVGRNPSSSVLALVSSSIVVTGAVVDIRPYLQHAAVVVAPLRVARGIQNKILEAMAMSRPVVASLACVKAIAANPHELIAASSADDFFNSINMLLAAPNSAESIGQQARQHVIDSYGWTKNLSAIDYYLLPDSIGSINK